MHSTKYIFGFVSIMTVIVALVLSVLSIGWKDRHQRNEAIFNKRAILAAVEKDLGDNVKADKIADDEVVKIFKDQIEQLVVDMDGNIVDPSVLEERGYKGGQAENIDMKKEKKRPEAERIRPVFIFTKSNGEKYYIVSVRGNGLWDEIWGNVALRDDLKTIVGASFDHQGETPGLGAEIKDNPAFRAQFAGKEIYNDDGVYTSVVVKKGGLQDPKHQVDAISGATVTSVGVSEMLVRGLKYYEPYFKSLSKG